MVFSFTEKTNILSVHFISWSKCGKIQADVWFDLSKSFPWGLKKKKKIHSWIEHFLTIREVFFRSFFGNVLTPLQLRVIDQVQLCTHTLELHNVVTAVKEFSTSNACQYGAIQELCGPNLIQFRPPPSQVDKIVHENSPKVWGKSVHTNSPSTRSLHSAKLIF